MTSNESAVAPPGTDMMAMQVGAGTIDSISVGVDVHALHPVARDNCNDCNMRMQNVRAAGIHKHICVYICMCTRIQ